MDNKKDLNVYFDTADGEKLEGNACNGTSAQSSDKTCCSDTADSGSNESDVRRIKLKDVNVNEWAGKSIDMRVRAIGYSRS